jgi:hypothetical protein
MLNGGTAPRAFWPPERSLATYAALILLLAGVYAALCLSPSSYALALRALGLQQDGLILGTPKALRSDEWAIWTPYVQIAVNNGFERLNATSPYGEDLRNFNALPLKDWALAFKPQFWAFGLVDPAYAFSIHHAVLYAAFLIGWPLLLRALGFPAHLAIGGGLLLFASSYTQLWWTTTGPLLAGFPWILIALLSRLSPWLKLPLLAWLTTAWLISHLYPPIIVTLGFLGAAAILAFRRDALTFGNVATAAAAAMLAGALAWLYLAGPMTVMSHTVYPGARNLPGGQFPPLLLLAQIFPFLVTNGHDSLIGHNYLEVATGGSYLVLLTLIFLDHRALLRTAGARTAAGHVLRIPLAVLLGALALILTWLLLPLPAWVGAPLLWNLVHPHRFVFVLGALSLLLALTALAHVPLRFGPGRLAAAAGLLVLACIGSKWGLAPKGAQADFSELWILPALGILVLLHVRIRLPASTALIGAALFANAAAFVPYNPLQSAWPIFQRPHFPRASELQIQQEEHPRGWLVAPGYPGAVLNGWGLRSIAHVQIAPRLDFFRSVFPDMEDGRFEAIFNRYAHLSLAPIATPVVPADDLILLPLVAFGPTILPPTVVLSASRQSTSTHGGHLDVIRRDGDDLTLTGWMMAEGRDRGRRLIAQVDDAQSVLSIATTPRPDVADAIGNPRLARAGFALELRLAAGAADPATLCLWSDSQAFGRRLLTGGRNCP